MKFLVQEVVVVDILVLLELAELTQDKVLGSGPHPLQTEEVVVMDHMQIVPMEFTQVLLVEVQL